MKRFREFIEKVLYAGMRPGAMPASPAKRDWMRWSGPLREPLERFLSAGAAADPLYLSNRSPMRKFLTWCAIGVPFAGMVVLLFLAASGQFSRRPPAIAGSQQAAAVMDVLPNYKDVQLKTTQDIVVMEAHLERQTTPATLSGSIKNVSSRRIQNAEIIFDLMDRAGSLLAGAAANVENIEPQATAGFQVKVPDRDAVIAIVREIYVR